MGAYQQISQMYKNGIKAKAVELNYSSANLCILDGDINILERDFPDCYKCLKSCIHNKDARSMIDYAKDLIASWIFEDTIVQMLNAEGLVTSLSGSDKNRQILATTKVSSTSDCIVSFEGKSRHLEIMSDYTGWWERMGHIDLRDAKFLKLSREKALFLGICTKTTKYVLLDFATQINANYIPSHRPYGGKPAYSIPLPKEALSKFLMPPLMQQIKTSFNAV